MRLGYACINSSIGCKSASTFRLASYTQERFRSTVENNIMCLQRILKWNLEHGLLAFRITSDLIPFASHPVCDVDWRREFRGELAAIGDLIKATGMRVSMHPGQYTLINSTSPQTNAAAVADLMYHTQVLDCMGLGPEHKVQIHVGGLYGDKEASMARFIARYRELPGNVRRRLVIENDDRIYGLGECLQLHAALGMPILFDSFHLSVKEPETSLADGLSQAASTWKPEDGPLMIDYSSQDPDKRAGAHAQTIDLDDFRKFLTVLEDRPADIILEIKDKELSALRALPFAARELPAPAGE